MRGGKPHEFVVEILGMPAGDPTITSDGVGIHLAKPTGLPNAAAIGNVLEHRLDLLGRKPSIAQRRPLPLGKPSLARATSKHPSSLLGSVTMRHSQISDPPLAIVGALGIQAAEAREIVHVSSPSFDPQRE